VERHGISDRAALVRHAVYRSAWRSLAQCTSVRAIHLPPPTTTC